MPYKCSLNETAFSRIACQAQIDLLHHFFKLLIPSKSLLIWIFSWYCMNWSLCTQSVCHRVLSVFIGLWSATPYYRQPHAGSDLLRWLILIRLLFVYSPVTSVITICHLAKKGPASLVNLRDHAGFNCWHGKLSMWCACPSRGHCGSSANCLFENLWTNFLHFRTILRDNKRVDGLCCSLLKHQKLWTQELSHFTFMNTQLGIHLDSLTL